MTDFPRGLIEGFYGREWSWQDRAGFAPFLKSIGMDFYIYAPKGDDLFRKNWRTPLPEPLFQHLHNLQHDYSDAGVRFGIGLSPYGYEDTDDQQVMIDQIARVNEIDPDMLCVLFDDMPGDDPHLARKQIDLVNLIAEQSTARHFIVCPSYYTTQPILEKIFGAMPENYLQDFGKHIPQDMDIFWTGENVISHEISEDHLTWVTDILQRKPFIWDNAFSNDAQKTSPFIRPFVDYPSPQMINGQAFNGMNQAEIFKISLEQIVTSCAPIEACKSICGDELGTLLSNDFERLFDKRQDTLTKDDQAALHRVYDGFDHPVAKQFLLWVDGEYEFDPDCFT